MLFLTMGLTQSVLGKNTCFYKYTHNSGRRGSPDMILTAFDAKFHEKKDELPPDAWNPHKNKKHTTYNKCNPKWVAQNPRPPARAGGPGGGSPPEKPLCVA